MNYVQKIKIQLDNILEMSGTDYEGLLEVYALLVLTVGKNCTNENIHDAWSLWQNITEPKHKSLKPFKQLIKKIQNLDEPYRQAVIKVSKTLT